MRIAACVIVRDEAPIMAEWLAFHHVVGFDRLIVFDNGSVDRTREIVRTVARGRKVTLVPWPALGPRTQILAYQACLTLFGPFYDWIAFIDADEFLVPADGASVKSVLSECDDFAALAVPWKIFGSNGHEAMPDALTIEAFTRCAPDIFQENRCIKSIVRPGRARFRDPHRFHVRGVYGTPAAKPVLWDGPNPYVTQESVTGPLRVHHYFTRSRAHWRLKMARGYRDIVRADDHFEKHDRNEIEDMNAVRFAPLVKAELALHGLAPD